MCSTDLQKKTQLPTKVCDASYMARHGVYNPK